MRAPAQSTPAWQRTTYAVSRQASGSFTVLRDYYPCQRRNREQETRHDKPISKPRIESQFVAQRNSQLPHSLRLARQTSTSNWIDEPCDSRGCRSRKRALILDRPHYRHRKMLAGGGRPPQAREPYVVGDIDQKLRTAP